MPNSPNGVSRRGMTPSGGRCRRQRSFHRSELSNNILDYHLEISRDRVQVYLRNLEQVIELSEKLEISSILVVKE